MKNSDLVKRLLASTLSLLLASGEALAAGPTLLPPVEPAGSAPVAAPQAAALSLEIAPGVFVPAALVPAALPAGLKAVPVTIEVPAAELAKLSPEQREDAAALVSLFQKRLFTWEDFAVKLPRSSFDGGAKPLISLDDLFQAPTNDEVRRIGTSDHGRGPKLDAAQLAQVRAEGRFTVPSLQYPGQSHVWQLSPWLQKGRRNVAETLKGHEAKAAAQVAVSIPNRVAGERPVSLRRGVESIGRGARELADLLVGLPDQRAANGEAAIRGFLEKRLLSRLSRTAADPRLYDEELWKKAAPLAAEAQRSAEPGDEALYGALLKDKALEALSPGLGRLLVDRLKAQVIVRGAEEDFARETGQASTEARTRLAAEHPILSRVPAWREPRIARAAEAWRADNVWSFYERLPFVLMKAGLGAQAQALAQEITFYRDEAPSIRRGLEAQLAPNRTFSFSRRFWSKDSWKIERHEPEPGQVYYSAQKSSTFQVNSGQLFWRKRNGLWRTVTWWNNALYHLLVTNLWNGPLGLKSLFFNKPFAYNWEINRKTGRLELSTIYERGTLASRIKSSWASRRKILDDFEKDQNYGFLGKDVRRFFLFFSADLLRGLIVPALLVVLQPVLTAANLAVGLAATATSMLWAPAAVTVAWAFNALVYDTDRAANAKPYFIPLRLLPAVDRVVGDLAIGGVGESAASVAGIGAHAVIAGFQLGLGLARTILNSVWDAFMGAIIRWRGRVPPKDYRGLRRIAGPGLSADHFFQVPSDLVLVALQAGLESEALESYSKDATDLIFLPQRAYESVMKSIQAVIRDGFHPSDRSPAYSQIAAKQKDSLEALRKAVEARRNFYYHLLANPKQNSIKLAASDYELVLKKSVVLTRNFYADFFAAQGWDAARVGAFWKEKGLAAGDWEGLAKAQLSRIFTPGILVPLEDADKTLRIRVNAPDLRDYAAGLEKGILPEQLADITLTGVGPAGPAQPAPTKPAAGDLLNDRGLMTPPSGRP